jgi:hypothetical protein
MGEMRERMLRGELYIPDDPDNGAAFRRIQELLGRFNGTEPAAWEQRDAVLREILRRVGESVVVRPPFGWEYAEPITIADNVWLGGGVIVCPGVTIGQDTVVGAGAVVTKDLPPGVVAAGVPARILREIGERDRVDVPAI